MGKRKLDSSLAGTTETPHHHWELGHGWPTMEPKKAKETYHFKGDGRGGGHGVQEGDLGTPTNCGSKDIGTLKVQIMC